MFGFGGPDSGRDERISTGITEQRIPRKRDGKGGREG